MMEMVDLNDGNSLIVPFGKYKGIPITDVYEDDTEYFQWMYDNMDLPEYFSNILENMISTGLPF